MSKSTQVKPFALRNKIIVRKLTSKYLTNSKRASSQACHNPETLPSKKKLAVYSHSSLRISERPLKSKTKKPATSKRRLWKECKELKQEEWSKMKMKIGCTRIQFKKILKIEGQQRVKR